MYKNFEYLLLNVSFNHTMLNATILNMEEESSMRE
jgi:hypothetical protein